MIIYLLKGLAIVNVSKSVTYITVSAMLYITTWFQLTALAHGKHGDFSQLIQHNLRPWLNNLSTFFIN